MSLVIVQIQYWGLEHMITNPEVLTAGQSGLAILIIICLLAVLKGIELYQNREPKKVIHKKKKNQMYGNFE